MKFTNQLDKITKDMESNGGHLICNKCHHRIDELYFKHYLSIGWPICCGETMELITKMDAVKLTL